MRTWILAFSSVALLAAPAFAGLTVHVSTGMAAKTFLDGQFIGDAPLSILDIKPGQHTISVENPSDHTTQSQVVMSPRTVRVEKELSFLGAVSQRTLLSSTTPYQAAAPYQPPAPVQSTAPVVAAPPPIQYVARPPVTYYVRRPVYYDPYDYDPFYSPFYSYPYYSGCSPFYSGFGSGFGISLGFGFGGCHHWGGGWFGGCHRW